MKKYTIAFILMLGMAACTRNAVTGRKELNLIPNDQLQQMALTEYKSFLSQNKVIGGTVNKDAEMVRRVGSRIATAITDYYSKQGKGDVLKGYNWEFNLVDSKEINAWCMPGGKVVVYTGLLPVTQNEAALAIVLGHEITHAVAQHGNERMSQEMITQGLGSLVDVATSNNPKVNGIFKTVYGPASQVGFALPNSRNQEYEADHFGLLFASMAGYNPKEAISFWQRMEKASSDTQKQPEFLATHPADENRIKRLEGYMDEALQYYHPVH